MKEQFDLQKLRKGKSRGSLNPKKSVSERKYPVRTYLTLEEKTKLKNHACKDERDLSTFVRIVLKNAECI